MLLGFGGVVAAGISGAAPASVGLGTAESFAVLAGSGITNTGPTVVIGDLGTCPTPAITGFTGPPDGAVVGTIHANDAVACQAKSDLVVAYDDAAGRAPTTTFPGPTDLGGMTLKTGVYKSPVSFAITGTLTLDAEGDPNAVFIFQAGSTLITASNSRVVLVNGAQACNVFWQVGSSATLGVGSRFVGTILALTSITANTTADVQGRLLARNGAVTLDSNTITRQPCAVLPTTTTLPGPTTTTSSTTTTVPGPTTTSSTTTTVPGPTTTTSSTTTTVPGPTTTSSTVPATSTTVPDTGAGGVSGVTSTTTSTTTTSTTTTSTTTVGGVGGVETGPGAGAATTTTVGPSTGTTSVSGFTGGGPGASGGDGSPTLARTGADLDWLVLLGSLASAVGIAAVAASRTGTRERRVPSRKWLEHGDAADPIASGRDLPAPSRTGRRRGRRG